MKRRIILMIGTFMMLSAAVWIYHLISGGMLVWMPEDEDFPKDTSVDPSMLKGLGPEAREGWEVDIQYRDKEGRLRSRYRARKWIKRGGGNYLLTGPNIVLYQTNGEHVYIRSDYADIFADEVGEGLAIRRGSLYGNVKIFLDRDTQRLMPQDKPEMFFVMLEDRPVRVVRIYAETLRFNNDLLEIESDRRIVLLSDEADICGRGISIRWNEEPRELRELRILHGQYMAIYNMPAELGIFSLPGPAVATRPATMPTEVAAATQAATALASAPATQATTATAPASGPVARPASSTTQTATASAPAGGLDAALAATRPTRPASRPTTQPRNIYLAEFVGSQHRIHVNSGNRQLAGANKLALMFEWGQERSRLAQSGGRTAAATRPGVDRAATAPSQPVSLDPARRPATTTSPAKPPAEPVIITWSGPLTIRPIGYTATPSSRRYTLSAEGQLKLSDSKASAACRRLIYQLPQQRGWLIADKDSDVRIDSGDDQEVVCRWMEFSRVKGMAYLKGPGYMARRPVAVAPAAATRPASATEPASMPATAPAGEDRITWAGTLEVTFGQKRFVDEKGKPHTRQFIKNATFREKVELSQGRSGDFVRCDKLYVEMARDDKNRAFPSKAVAGGNVLARQETSDIRAQEVTVTFDRQSRSGGDDELRLRPVTLTARGEVGITDTRDKEILTASADRLSSDLVKRIAVLFGDDEHFATITQGPNYLAGDELRLDELAESVVVNGRGELKFFSDRNLSGGKLDEPRPVRIEWDKGMEYAAGGDTAKFDGDVVLGSGLDSMKCRNMRVMFEEIPDKNDAKDKTRGQPKPKDKHKTSTKSAEVQEPARRLGVSMQQYSRRKLSMIVADKDVLVRSREQDEKKRLLQRLQMTGDQLVYDLANSKMQVLGSGTLVAEDYRKPRSPKKKKDSEEAAAGIERPWQTLFEWRKSMEYWQLERRVKLQDRISMVHRSGAEVVMSEKLNVPKWKDLPTGRKSMLSCQELLAVFAEPKPKKGEDKEAKDKEAKDKKAKDKEAKDKESSEAFMSRGPRLGPLKLFTATGGVNLKDGPVQIMGERLVYELKEDGKKAEAEAVVWGSLPNKPVKNAKVYHEDPATGKSRSWASPTITVYFEGREIKEVLTKGVTGQGGG